MGRHPSSLVAKAHATLETDLSEPNEDFFIVRSKAQIAKRRNFMHVYPLKKYTPFLGPQLPNTPSPPFPPHSRSAVADQPTSGP